MQDVMGTVRRGLSSTGWSRKTSKRRDTWLVGSLTSGQEEEWGVVSRRDRMYNILGKREHGTVKKILMLWSSRCGGMLGAESRMMVGDENHGLSLTYSRVYNWSCR